jgi:hypothetical protein
MLKRIDDEIETDADYKRSDCFMRIACIIKPDDLDGPGKPAGDRGIMKQR